MITLSSCQLIVGTFVLSIFCLFYVVQSQLSFGTVDVTIGKSTMCHNGCSGHGVCVSNGNGPTCQCDIGWGSQYDITNFRAPDCSSRSCPSGVSWGSAAEIRIMGLSPKAHQFRECSNVGLCDYKTGTCTCPENFAGQACERTTCPNNCSGHGQCLSMTLLAAYLTAQPLSYNTINGLYSETNLGLYLGTDADGQAKIPSWEADKMYGCLCDSSWPVGLTSGTTQQAEWFGPDCSLRRCPSGDDPMTRFVDETNCTNVQYPGTSANGKGKVGNKCHVDCANRGVCDYTNGSCSCFKGFYGPACTLQSALSSGTSSTIPSNMINDDRTNGPRSRTRPDFLGRPGVDDRGQYLD